MLKLPDEKRAGSGLEGSDFELTLVPSRDDPRRYDIESVRPLDRCTALKTLRTFGVAGSTVPGSLLDQEEQGEGDTRGASAAARIRFIRLTPLQALSMFDAIRERDPNVRRLYAHLKGKNFGLIREQARCAVMRAYAADGTIRGEGIVMELPHRKADGTEALFHVSIKDGMAGEGEGRPGEVKVDYVIGCGKQAGTYKVKDEREPVASTWSDAPGGSRSRAGRGSRASFRGPGRLRP